VFTVNANGFLSEVALLSTPFFEAPAKDEGAMMILTFVYHFALILNRAFACAAAAQTLESLL